MVRWLLSILVNSITLIAVSGLFPDSFYIASIQTAILASLILSILNVLVKPLLIIITLPVTILSMGLFLLVINGITLGMAAYLIGPDFNISGLGTATLAAIIISILNYAIQKVFVKPLSEKR